MELDNPGLTAVEEQRVPEEGEGGRHGGEGLRKVEVRSQKSEVERKRRSGSHGEASVARYTGDRRWGMVRRRRQLWSRWRGRLPRSQLEKGGCKHGAMPTLGTLGARELSHSEAFFGGVLC